MADTSSRNGNGTALRVFGIVLGVTILMVSVSLNAVQASVASQTRDRVEEYRRRQDDQEIRLRAVEQAVGQLPYIRERVDEAVRLLREHMSRDVRP